LAFPASTAFVFALFGGMGLPAFSAAAREFALVLSDMGVRPELRAPGSRGMLER
jgi:hypothetical protein